MPEWNGMRTCACTGVVVVQQNRYVLYEANKNSTVVCGKKKVVCSVCLQSSIGRLNRSSQVFRTWLHSLLHMPLDWNEEHFTVIPPFYYKCMQ